MIVLVHGPDAATARGEATKLLKTHDPDDANTTRLDGRTINLPQAMAMVGTPGFLGQQRVVVIDDLMERAAKGNRSDIEIEETTRTSRGQSGGLDLGPLFHAVAPDNVLILVDPMLASIPASVRKAAPADVRIVSGEPPRGKALLDWIQVIATAAGNGISPGAAKELADLLFPQTWAAKPSNPRYDRPPNMELLRNEVEKLALAAHPGLIEGHHVRSMTEAGSLDRLFPFVEAASAGQMARAVTELKSLQDAGEDGHRLIAQLCQQIELSAVHEAAGASIDPVSVGKALGLANPNRMIGIARSPRRRPTRQVIAETVALDREMKIGKLRDPIDALHGLITLLADSHDDQIRKRRSH